eukprot:766583-Hanusia_phi.AAC.3
MLPAGRTGSRTASSRHSTAAPSLCIRRQGDEGDSMFIVVEGQVSEVRRRAGSSDCFLQLSVLVSFGSGSEAYRKEVAVLPSGAVMGEMRLPSHLLLFCRSHYPSSTSLVLGKPRSATCLVKSDTCSVAEITKGFFFPPPPLCMSVLTSSRAGALTALLQSRPYLARELEEIVHRRDTSNYLLGERKRGGSKGKKQPQRSRMEDGGWRMGGGRKADRLILFDSQLALLPLCSHIVRERETSSALRGKRQMMGRTMSPRIPVSAAQLPSCRDTTGLDDEPARLDSTSRVVAVDVSLSAHHDSEGTTVPCDLELLETLLANKSITDMSQH